MELLSNVSWFTPTWDLFVILFMIIAGFLLGLSLGRNRLLILLISIYSGIVVINFFPFGDIFELPKTDENFVYPIAVFIVTIILFFFLLSNSALNNTFKKTGNRSLVLIFIFSLFCIGLILSVVLSFFPKDLITTFNPITQVLFMAKLSKFLWALFPVLGMAIIGRKKKGRYNKY